MKSNLGIITVALILTSAGGVFGATAGLTGEAFVTAFNATAASNHIDKVAKFEKCRRVAGCLYRISDHTIILISYKRDEPIKQVVVMTTVSPKEPSVKDVFSMEDSAVWPVVI